MRILWQSELIHVQARNQIKNPPEHQRGVRCAAATPAIERCAAAWGSRAVLYRTRRRRPSSGRVAAAAAADYTEKWISVCLDRTFLLRLLQRGTNPRLLVELRLRGFYSDLTPIIPLSTTTRIHLWYWTTTRLRPLSIKPLPQKKIWLLPLLRLTFYRHLRCGRVGKRYLLI